MRIDIDLVECRPAPSNKKSWKCRSIPLYRQEIKLGVINHYRNGELVDVKRFDDLRDVIHITLMVDKGG